MKKAPHEGKGCQAGFSLLELAIVTILIGVAASLAVPLFSRAIEQSRVDEAAARLQLIWTAQRVYWLKYGHSADSLSTLAAEGLVDSLPPSGDGPLGFTYEVEGSDVEGVVARATPVGRGGWVGDMTIDTSGRIDGGIEAPGEEAIVATAFVTDMGGPL